ncbi:phosphate acyltransferase PlsX [Hypericibacter sp.]|uniref:phosphate acyltransferase PlsX n=1 Tax=Hypericibacter sp. TaxID=2705401 RepID=UPI003D6C9666
MTGQFAIALDAMGGDRAPEMVVKGANIARQRFPEVHFLFFGDEKRLKPLVDKYRALAKVSTIHHTDQVVKGEDKPSTALRAGRSSSMRLAIDAVQSGDAAGVVSAGNTGALMAMAKVVLKTLPGITRPAIASFFPTLKGESVMLDLGANVQCDADNLVQFAVMGNVFARTVLGVVSPTMGLLNVGSEDMKGHEALREASAMLREFKLPGSFHGFVEGDDIAKGTVDVVVTDGFTGNIALKSIEGTAKLYAEFMRATFKSSFLSKLGYLLARPALNALRLRTDPRRYNGAIFMGLNGIAVKSHGGTDALGFSNAIGVAADMIAHRALARITEDFGNTAAVSRPQAAEL